MEGSERKVQAPSVEILSVTEDEISVKLTKSNLGFANAIRRIPFQQVPTMAFDIITIQTNSSNVHDQMLALTIGLIPLDSTHVDKYRFMDQCKYDEINGHQPCAGCVKCTVRFSLSKKNITDKTLVVNSNDFVCLEEKSLVSIVKMSAPIFITTLEKGQSLRLLATARKGTASENAKWCPVTISTCLPIPQFAFSEKLQKSTKMQEQLRLCCPKKVFSVTQEQQMVVGSPLSCNYCQKCQNVEIEDLDKQMLKGSSLVLLKPSETDFIITMESVGTMRPEVIFRKTMVALRNIVTEIAREVDQDLESD